MPVNIFGLMPEQVKTVLHGRFPDYRYRQLCDWIYQKLESDPDKMSNLPKEMNHFLIQEFSFALPLVDTALQAEDGTTKYRLKLDDATMIEMVLIPADSKRTLCVSSQVGCARNCSFCATATMGLARNLNPDEIVGQVMLASKLCSPKRLTNLVFMGMGEPMDNLDNVLDSLRIIQAEHGLAFSPRRTTLSTCGIPEGIKKIADSGIKTKLAVSLNSAIDDKRDMLMPVNKRYPLRELKQSLFYYLSKSKFRATFEYILIPDINMGKEDIKALKRFVGDLSCKINFIPYNSVTRLPYRSPTEIEIEAFMKEAACLNQAITLRRSRGTQVCGACGQLAAI